MNGTFVWLACGVGRLQTRLKARPTLAGPSRVNVRTPPAVWAQAIPFHIERRVPCTDPYLGKALVHRGEGRAEKGHLNY